MLSFRQFLAEEIKDISDEVIRQVLGLLTPEELASLDDPSPETNKKIFRRLAKELHPDITGREATEVEKAALRIFGKGEADNAKTFDRLKQVKQTSQATATPAEAPRTTTAQEPAQTPRGTRQPPPQQQPSPPPSIKDAVSSSSAVGGEANTTQRFGRKTVDVVKKVYNATKQGVVDFGLGAGRETVKVGQDVAQGGFGLGGGKAPVSISGRVLPIGAGVDLALQTGLDLYDISNDPQWIYKAPTYADALKAAGTNIAISTGVGAGIGAIGAGPAGAGAGAVAGALEGIATSGYGLAQAPMKMGYSERQTLDNLKARLETEKTLLQNNPEADATENYSGNISAIENAIKEMEKGESFESKLSKGVDSAFSAVQNTPVTVHNPASWAIGLAKKAGFIPGTDDEVRAQETRTPEQLRADAEAAFEKRYPQGIRGGLAPGKSAAEVEKEAATDIINRLNAGAKPQDLAKELGWETDKLEKARQERAEKSVELMTSDPEKYGKMSETELDSAAAAKAVTDRAARVADELKASRDAEQKKKEEEYRIKDQEAAQTSKNLEAMSKKLKEMPSLEQQKQMAKEKLRKAMEKSKASSV